MTDTPETDEEHQTMPMGGFTLDFARKLERERDEAVQLLRNIRAEWNGMKIDNHCDCSDCQFLRPIGAILSKYKTTNQND